MKSFLPIGWSPEKPQPNAFTNRYPNAKCVRASRKLYEPIRTLYHIQTKLSEIAQKITKINIEKTHLSVILQDLDVEAEGNRFRRRRRFTILAIVAIFATTAAILVLSVVHAELSRPQLGNYTEFTCGAEDAACKDLLCPQGYTWSQQTDTCDLKKGEFNQKKISRYRWTFFDSFR